MANTIDCANYTALGKFLEAQGNEEVKMQDMIDVLHEEVGVEYNSLKEKFDSIVIKYGFEYDFETYVKEEL